MMARTRDERSSGVTLWLRQVGIGRLAAISILAIGAGYFSFALAVSGVARFMQPALAVRFLPSESEALAKQADLLQAANPNSSPSESVQLARRALLSQDLNPRALRIIAYADTKAGNISHARRLIELSSALSRREPGTQLWLINRAALDGNLPLALEHIDILLRTETSSEPVLYPIMLRGLVDPAFRKLLQSYMRNDRASWVGAFVTYAITNAEDLSPLISLAEDSEGTAGPGFTIEQSRLLMSRLAKAGRFGALQRIYLLSPDAKPFRLRNPQFDSSDASEKFGIAGWQAFEGSDAGASFVSRGKDSAPAMLLYVNPSTTQTVASKLLYLEPGSYALTTLFAEFDRGDNGSLAWQLRCPSRTAGGIPWTGSLVRNQSTLTMTVPTDCRVQFLDLVASGGEGQTGVQATVSSVKLAPLGVTGD